MTAAAHNATYELDTLRLELGGLVHRRQVLRAGHAGRDELEPNRREIVRLQQRLTAVLIALHRPTTG